MYSNQLLRVLLSKERREERMLVEGLTSCARACPSVFGPPPSQEDPSTLSRAFTLPKRQHPVHVQES